MALALEEQQRKAFRAWLNGQLEPHTGEVISNLEDDLADGVALLNLLQICVSAATGAPPNLNQIPHTDNRLRRLDNCAFLFQEFERYHVSTINVGPQDIVDGNSKLVLGLVWRLVDRFSVCNQASEEAERDTGKEALLAWCRERCSGVDGFRSETLVDFGTSFQDGTALCALLQPYNRGAYLCVDLDPANRLANLQQALRVAEDLGVPAALTAEELAGRVDEKAVMCFIALLRQKMELADENALEALRQQRLAEQQYCQCTQSAATQDVPLAFADGPCMTGMQLRSYAPGKFDDFAAPEQMAQAVPSTTPAPAPVAKDVSTSKSLKSGLLSGFNKAKAKAKGLGEHIIESGAVDATKELASKFGTALDVVTAGGKSGHFAQLFYLPPYENLLNTFNCTMLTSQSSARDCEGVTGTLYLGEQIFGFASDSLSKLHRRVVNYTGEEIKVCVPYNMSAPPCQTLVGKSASRGLTVTTADGFQFVFYGFLSSESRSDCVRVLRERVSLMQRIREASNRDGSAMVDSPPPPSKPLPPIPGQAKPAPIPGQTEPAPIPGQTKPAGARCPACGKLVRSAV